MYNLKSLGEKIENYWHWPVLLAVVGIFFTATTYFNARTQEFQRADGSGVDFVKWTSPDETANYIFTKYFAQEGKMVIEEKYNLEVSDIMHPRSFRSDNGEMKPMSFLGIILIYGTIAKIFSYRIISYLTPLFASLGIIIYYLLIKRIFGRRNALISSLLLAVFPVYIYYTMRSMFHNVLFMVFLITGFYFAMVSMQQLITDKLRQAFFISFSGLFFGLAAITRTSELIWIAPVLFVAWLLNSSRAGWLRPLFFAAFFMLALSPVLYFNNKLYGSPYSGGYAEMNTSINTIRSASSEILLTTTNGEVGKIKPLLESIKKSVFYFGFDAGKSLRMFKYYFIRMFPIYFVASIIGLAFFVYNWKEVRRRKIMFIIFWVISSAILVFYYGSWEFHDNPDPRSFTIGNSYTRYWLPIYLGAIPFVALAIDKASRSIGKVLSRGRKDIIFHSMRLIMITSALMVVSFTSIHFLLFGSEEGLAGLYKKAKQARGEWAMLLRSTPNNSAIITRYHDKLLFPERKVIVGDFNDNNMNKLYAVLADKLPLYYYNFTLPQKDVDYLNNRRLADFGLSIAPTNVINNNFSLYKIEKRK